MITYVIKLRGNILHSTEATERVRGGSADESVTQAKFCSPAVSKDALHLRINSSVQYCGPVIDILIVFKNEPRELLRSIIRLYAIICCDR